MAPKTETKVIKGVMAGIKKLPEDLRTVKPVKGVSPAISKRRVPLGGFKGSLASGAGAHPNFGYQGGPIIPNPRVFTIYLGNWASAANQARANRLDQFISDLMNSEYMNMLAQYGVGSSGTFVQRVFISSNDHDISQSDLNTILQNAIDSNQIPEPTNPSNCYIVFLDDATGINDAPLGIRMCEPLNDNAFGFHDFYNTNAGNNLFFSIIPGLSDQCLTNSCPMNDAGCSLHLAQTQEQRQTQVCSHEFSEMITDPLNNSAWVEPGVAENGDICNGQAANLVVGPNTWNVQLMYSKWDDMQSNGATQCVIGSPFALPSLLPACTVILDRSTFGKDEVDAFLNAPATPGPAIFDAALYIAVDGFTANQLGITAASFIGTPNKHPSFGFAPGVAGLSITATSLSAPDPGTFDIIQRFTWACQVKFTSDAEFPNVVGASTPVTVTATMATVSGAADIILVDEPNPYELDGSTSWLSTDVRVFQINAGDSKFGETMGANAAAAPVFIQNIVGRLNSGNTAGQAFTDISTDESGSALELSETVNGVNVFNFAVAKVRFRSLIADANDVRVFFRLFPCSTTSTVYDLGTTYRRGGQAGVVVPKLGLVGGQTTTIPCFASDRIDSASHGMDEQTDETNHHTLTHDGSGAEVVRYFGCWIDINQPSQPQFPISPAAPIDGPYASGRQTIQDLVRNAHQCLTAEISMDGSILVHNGDTPGSSDKLAQRNLSIVASDNPGGPASHRIPNTFEIKPTLPNNKLSPLADELLIDWGNTPVGSEASIYIPASGPGQILSMANSMYPKHRLTAADDHTVKFPAQGVTYIPIPPGAQTNFPGLLTLDLPGNVVKGQTFKVVIRQLSNAAGVVILPPPPVKAGMGRDGSVVQPKRRIVHWRKVIGAFQITVPVSKKEYLLAPEERLLANLKWIKKSIPTGDRWFPVFDRYVGIVSDRVEAFGGHPDAIIPSPNDRKLPKPAHPKGEDRLTFLGKIASIVFDRYGDFEGFTLDTEDGDRKFRSRERDIESVIERAWAQRILVSVIVERDDLHHPESIVFLQPPRPFKT